MAKENQLFFITSITKRLFKSVMWRATQLIKKTYGRIINTECSVCRSKGVLYLPLKPYYKQQLERYGYKYFGQGETINIEKYNCPVCAASDRDRLYALYFMYFFNQADKNKSYDLLHIAPTECIGKFLSKFPFIKQRTADLMMKNVQDKVDITDMHIYTDQKFDFFICSHVLEHVDSPDKAMGELFRVLKIGGKGIVMVPIIPGIDETLEDPSHITPEERWRNYGQDDHLRLFGKKDFVKRLQKSGFVVHQLGVDFFGKNNFRKNAIKDRSILYVVEK